MAIQGKDTSAIGRTQNVLIWSFQEFCYRFLTDASGGSRIYQMGTPTTGGALTYYHRPQRSWGKVIFSQASVILSTGGCGGACSGGGAWSRGVPGPGGVSALGGSAQRGAPGVLALGGLVRGVVPGPGEVAWWRPPGMATAAVGTHPTEMHSCLA